MQNQTGGVVLDQGHIFGFTSGKKSWICQNLKTGEDVWSERRKLREGSILYADKHFYLYEEQTGTLVLIEANTKEWVEKGRFTIPKRSQQNLPSGKIWTHPVISHGKLYLRDQELLFCFNVAKN
ncbi:MAG: hypothetical protein KatS3mg105_0406 [Gemmatales bacterium]|nr:MAG: hypothetical protein KatS3mg105_0406 [Gemmatales bacterium]